MMKGILMFRILAAAGLLLGLAIGSAYGASTINRTQPVQGAPYNASPIRLNFNSAANDINALQTLNAGVSAPSNPSVGYLWLSTPTSGTLDPLNIWDGTSWVPVAALDTANHLWTPPVGGGTAPTIVAAASTDLGSVQNSTVTISGIASIQSYGSSAPTGTLKVILFTAATPLVNSASLILPGHTNITQAAGGVEVALAKGGGIWQVIFDSQSVLAGTGINGTFVCPTISTTNGVITAATGLSACPLNVANNAALKALPIPVAGTVAYRAGFATAGDGGGATYTFASANCTLNSGVGDNGTQVQPDSATGCWLLSPPARPSIALWGATTSSDIMPYLKTAWQSGINRCIYIPAGIWPVESSQTFAVNGAVNGPNLAAPCFVGDPPGSHLDGASPPNVIVRSGTWLYWPAASDGIASPFIINGTAPADLDGIGDVMYANPSTTNIGFVEDQPTPGAGWAPNPYTWWFTINSLQDYTFDNLVFLNDSLWINTITSGRIRYGTILGQPLSTGALTITDAFDFPRIDYLYMKPIWSNESDVNAYMRTVDPLVTSAGFLADRIFGLYYHSLIKSVKSVNNQVPINGHINQLNCDSIGLYCIWDTASDTNWNIGQMYFGATVGAPSSYPAGQNGIELDGSADRYSIGQLFVVNPVGCNIYKDNNNGTSNGNFLAIGNLTFLKAQTYWGADGSGCKMLEINNTTGSPGQLQISNLQKNGIPLTNLEDNTSNGIYRVAGLPIPWTPAFSFAGGGSVTLSSATGFFWDDPSGNVTVSLSLIASSASSPTGNASITGLPITCSAAGGLKDWNGTAAQHSAWTGLAATPLRLVIAGGGSTISLLQDSATGDVNVTGSNFTNTTQMQGQTYCHDQGDG